MAIEVHYNTAHPVWLEPSDGVLATTATAVLRRSTDTVLETLSVTLPTAGSRTVASGTTREAVVVSDASGVTVGHKWRVISDGVTHVFTVARVDSTTVYPSEPLAVVPDTGSAFEPLRMTASISAPGTSEIGENLRLEWLYDDGTTEGFASDTVHVVRWKWNSPISAARIREHVALAFPSVVQSREAHYWDRIADEVDDRIRQEVNAAGRRPFLYGDPDVFKHAGLACAQWLLARDGIVPRTSNPGIYLEQMRGEFDREMLRAMSSLNTYDSDGDGAIDAQESLGLWWSVRLSR